MNKIFVVAKTEYAIALRSKAFIIGVLMTPILIGISVGAQYFLNKHVDIEDRKCAIVDHSGLLYPILEDAIAERNANQLFRTTEDGEQKQQHPKFILERYIESEDPEQTDLILSKRVQQNELFAYLVIDKEILSLDKPADSSGHQLAYHTQNPTYKELPNWLRHEINKAVLSKRFEAADIDRELVQTLSKPVYLTSLGLAKIGKDGSLKAAKKDNELKTFGIPIGSVMLLFILTMTAVPNLLNQVLEEKMQKISEVLISSVSPFQLLMGKLLGTVATTLTLSLLYLGVVHFCLWYYKFDDLIEPSTYLWFLLFLILALFMFGSVFSAIGASCSEIKDAQSLMTPAMIIIMAPIFLMQFIIESPNSVLATSLSLFPPTTPVIMMLRIALPPGPPVWQIIVGVVLTGAFTVASIGIAGKIFRIGILSQGQAPSYAKLLKWVLSK